MSSSETKLGSPGSRLRDLRKQLKLSQGVLADQIDISQSTLSQIENDHYTLSLTALAALGEQYGVNCNWLISGKGEIFFENANNTDPDKFTGAVLPIVNVLAHAGLPEDRQREDEIMEVGHYVLPGFISTNKEYRIFPIEGQSMEPTLYEGDFAVCSRISDKSLESVKEGTVVVVDTEVGVIIKRYYKHDDEELYLLDSDSAQYKPEILSRNEIRNAWRVEGLVTRQLGQVGALPNNRLQHIEQELAQLKQLLTEMKDAR